VVSWEFCNPVFSEKLKLHAAEAGGI